MIDAPRGRQEVPVQSADNDDETLEPHAGVNAHRDEENDQHVATAPAEPKQLRRQAIAKEHPEPPVPPVRAENAVPKRVPLEVIAAIPGNEELHRVRVTDE